MRVFRPAASNAVRGPTPLRPAATARQVVSTSLPKGLYVPIPVITTRAIRLLLHFSSLFCPTFAHHSESEAGEQRPFPPNLKKFLNSP
jgi:hypothetical protein